MLALLEADPRRTMQQTWDVSTLIDKGTRIHEARGMTVQHLGLDSRQVEGQALVDLVAPAQRAWFRRCIARLAAGEEFGIITADLQIGGAAPRPVFMTARPAKAEGRWWLMLAAHLPESLKSAVRKPDKPALASAREFLLLVEGAAQQISRRLDLMRVQAGILKDETAASPEVHASLRAACDQVVLGEAYDGIASRADAGEYLLLRDRGAPSGTLQAKLGAAAETCGIPQARLGLETSALQLSALGRSLSPAGLRRAAIHLRHRNHAAQRWEGAVMRQPFWLRPAVLAFGGVAMLSVGWFAL